MLPECAHYAIRYDELLNKDENIEYNAWLDSLLQPASLGHIRDFIAAKLDRDRSSVRFVDMARGAYNLVLQFRIRDGRTPARLAMRMPQRGFSAKVLAAERLENEVHWMQYLEEQTTVPIPHIYSWGVRGEAVDDQIGPYMLMDFVQGVKLHACLADWETPAGEDPAGVAAKKREQVFEQLAEIFLELRRQRFDKIGSITRAAEEAGAWAVTRRPLTYDMHAQLAGVPGFPTHSWPTGPLLHARDYVSLATEMRDQQLLCLRNINIPGTLKEDGYMHGNEGADIDMERVLKTARGRFLARRAMALPAAAAHILDSKGGGDDDDNDDKKPFVLVNPDLGAFNILVDPETARITALIDFEYTNAIPAAFANDPPMWLCEIDFQNCLEIGGCKLWLRMYEPILQLFLAVLERVEQRQQQQNKASQQPPLSALMRASWENKTFLLNYGIQRVHFADIIYHDQPDLFPAVPEAVANTSDWLGQMHDYEEYTRLQIGLYEAERMARYQE